MKIAFLVHHIGRTGGVNNMVLDMTSLFMQKGHDVKLFYFSDHETKMDFPCQTEKISFSKPIDFRQFDVVHCHGIRPNAYVLRHKPFRKISTRFVATIHCYVFQDFADLYGRVKGFLFSWLFLLSFLRMDTLVALSKDALKYYRRFYPFKDLTYAYNTRIMDMQQDLSEEEKKEVLDFKQNSNLIGMNCVLILRKGLDVMMKALLKLPSEYKLMVLGGYPSAEFEKVCNQLKEQLEGRVLFLGMRKDAYRYLPYYDVYVMASRSEGFPLSLVEAAAYGKRIASTDLAQFKEIFTNDEVAYCHPGDVDGLVQAIARANKEMQGAEDRVFEKYQGLLSPDRFYERYLSIYQKTNSLDY